jgi:hypothetical protein
MLARRTQPCYTVRVPDQQQKLSELLERYERDKTKPRTEADVSANFVDHLFAALGRQVARYYISRTTPFHHCLKGAT